MSFGFSVGDFFTGIQLCSEIIKSCSESVGASQSHRDFVNVVTALKVGLERLRDVIKERNHKAGGDRFLHDNDKATWECLKEVTFEFGVTLEEIKLRLKQYPATGVISGMLYWFNAKEEVRELLERCRHHITTINFILEPFKLKVMTDIQQTLNEIRIDVIEIRGVIEEEFDDLRGMLVQFGCPEPERVPAPRAIRGRTAMPVLPALQINSIGSLDNMFHNQLRHDWENPGIELKDISLSELTKSVVWWLEKSQMSTENTPDGGTLTPIEYLNLTKSAWVAGGFKDHPELQESPDENSLWHAYCKELNKGIEKVFNVVKQKRLQIPSMVLIHSLESHYFSPLIELEVEHDNTLAGYGEELILNLSLAGDRPRAHPTKFLAFRQGDGHLRCVEVVCDSRGRRGRVVKEIRREYIINRDEWNIRPFYMYHPEGGCFNLALYKAPETKPFTFKDQKDLFAFQHAFMGASVRYVNSNFKKIKYQGPAIMKGACGFSSGLLQLWYEKPRPSLDAEGNTPSTEASLSPKTTQSTTWSAAPSIAFSATTATTHKQDRKTTVVDLKPVEASRVFACLIGDKGTRQFITFAMGDEISFNNTSCCNRNYRLHPGRGDTMGIPRVGDDVCCRKLVIETVSRRGSFLVQVLESKKGDDDTFGISLVGKYLLKGSKSIKLSYFSITFGSKAEKHQFITEYDKLETIRRTKENHNRKLVLGLQRREEKGEQPRPEDISRPPRRSSTFPSFPGFLGSGRRGSSLS